MDEGGKWVTINGRRVFIKDKATNEYMNEVIREKTISNSKRKRNIVYEEKYNNSDIQILMTPKGYRYKTKMPGETKYFYDEGYDYDFKQEAINNARRSVDERIKQKEDKK